MLKSAVFILALSCTTPKIINTSGEPFNQHDKDVMKYCGNRCKVIYPDAPCVATFTKKTKSDYNCICKEEKKKK